MLTQALDQDTFDAYEAKARAGVEAAQDPTLQAYMHRMDDMMAQQGRWSEDVACAWCAVGDAYQTSGQYDAADASYRLALAWFANQAAVNGYLSPDGCNINNKLGEIAVLRGMPQEAVPYYQTAAETMAELLRPYRPALDANDLSPAPFPEAEALPVALDLILVHSEAGWGEALRLHGQYQEAERHQRRALSLVESCLGDQHVEGASVLMGLGINMKYQARYDEAESYYRRAKALLEAEQGESHAALAPVYYNLGGVYHGRQVYAEGVPYVRQALALHLSAHARTHPTTPLYLTQLAALLDGAGEKDEAKRLYREAIGILEQHFGRIHRDIAMNLNNLGHLAAAAAEYDEAEACFLEALSIKEATLGRHHADVGTTLANLGFLYLDQGRASDAESLLTRAYTLMCDAFGRDHPKAQLLAPYVAQG